MVFKLTDSASRFQRKNRFWKKSIINFNCVKTHFNCDCCCSKKLRKSAFQTKPAKFDTFLPISRDSVHIFQNRFLCWNREAESVSLNTINPITRIIFFSLRKGSEPFWGAPEGKLSDVREVSNFFWYLPHGNGMGKRCQLIKIPHFGFFEPP